jgi:putative phosphoesterase
MRVAALYDIHGNLPALEAVLADVRAIGVDLVVVGGDIFPGPLSTEVLDRLVDVDIRCQFIRGNGDRAVLETWRGEESPTLPTSVLPSLRWLASRLGTARAELLAQWPPTLTLDIEEIGKVVFVHATPRNDTDIVTRRTRLDRLHEHFAGIDADVVVCGHTHMQFDLRVGHTRIVNAGSVGMPFGERGAYWLLLDGGVALRRTSFDFDAAAARICATDYPQADEFAARYILAPPTEEEMLTLYSR